MFADAIIAHNPAAHAVAEHDHVRAYRLPEDQVVECCNTIQVGGRHLEQFANVADALVGNPSPVPLYDLHGIDTDRFPSGIAGHFSLNLLPLFSRKHLLPFSSIHIRKHVVHCAKDGEYVGNHSAADEFRQHLHVSERWRSDACPVRSGASVANQVITVVTFSRFNRPERLTGRNHRTPTHSKKVRDQGFDVVHGSFLERWTCQWLGRLICALGHVVHALFDDAQALTHLFNAHRGAVVAVPMPACGNVEFELLVTGIRLLLAEVPLESAGAQIGTRDTPFDGLLRGEYSDAFGSRLEDPVLHDFLVVLDQARRQVL